MPLDFLCIGILLAPKKLDSIGPASTDKDVSTAADKQSRRSEVIFRGLVWELSRWFYNALWEAGVCSHLRRSQMRLSAEWMTGPCGGLCQWCWRWAANHGHFESVSLCLCDSVWFIIECGCRRKWVNTEKDEKVKNSLLRIELIILEYSIQ